MARIRAKCPIWAEKALQGLTFWMGHRQSLYSGYPLSEGALVAETCNLICANLLYDEALHCEVPYRALVLGSRGSTVTQGMRVDLVVATKKFGRAEMKRGALQPFATSAIEVKLASASRKKIDEDIRRLAGLKVQNPKIRTFLFLVSETKRPSRFVLEDGTAVRGDFSIEDTSYVYSVRRTCKATSSFSGHNSAHYACIIEIFGG